MAGILKSFRLSLLGLDSRWCLLFWLFIGSGVHAHLVDAQKGVLNLKADQAYLIMSIPVSGLKGIDDDADGLLSNAEFNAHSATIETQIKNGIELSSSKGTLPIKDLVINLSLSSGKPVPERQLLVMGHFSLAGMGPNLRFNLQIFGTQADELRQYITVTRGEESQLLTLTPEFPQRDVFPSYIKVLQDQIRLGIQHILEGTDHLLFLLVVLAAESSLWAIFSVLTAFTVGHAVTLVICNELAWTAPPTLVEPTIAATIVLIALWDLLRLGAKQKHYPLMQRVLLVFACSIVHGLGLADAFNDLGLSGTGKLISLAGFNAGIELGQLAVTFFGVLLIQLLLRWLGKESVDRMKNYFLVFAVILGFWWFLERIDVLSLLGNFIGQTVKLLS